MSVQRPTFRNGDVVLVQLDGQERSAVFVASNRFDDSLADVIFVPISNSSVLESVPKELLVNRIGQFTPDVMQILNSVYTRPAGTDKEDTQ